MRSKCSVGVTALMIVGVVVVMMVRHRYVEQIALLKEEILRVQAPVAGSATGMVMGVPCSTASEHAVRFPEADLTLVLPCGIGVQPNAESHRRGTFAAYDFLPIDRDYVPPMLAELQFFSKESIGAFDRLCDTAASPCFFGARFTSGDYLELKGAYEKISDWETWHMFVFHDRNWLVRSIPCTGDSCVIREYAMFHGETMIVVWVQMETLDQQEAADALFGSLTFSENS